MVTVVCVNWGTRYDPKYVRILEAQVRRNLSLPFEFVCITDRPKNYTCKTLPVERGLKTWWPKLQVFKLDMGRLLYLDLDIVITGSLDELVQVPSKFCIISDWHLPCFNSSVMVMDSGVHKQVWEDFRTYKASPGGDQEWITAKVPDAATFPPQWCVSYRSHAQPGVPKGAKVVVFHGQPKPESFPSQWVREYWRE